MKNYIIGDEVMTIQDGYDRNEIVKVLSTDLTNLIKHLRGFKSDNRTELDRRFAIAITEAEKLDAYISQCSRLYYRGC